MSGRYGWGPGHSSKTVFKGNKPVESWGVIPRTFIHELFPFSSGLSPCQAWQWLTHETAPFWISTHTHTQNPALRSLSLERQAWQKFGEFRLPSSNLVPLPLLRFVGKKSKSFIYLCRETSKLLLFYLLFLVFALLLICSHPNDS